MLKKWIIAFFLVLGLSSLSIAQDQSSNAEETTVDVVARIHFNTQTADFDRAREFYRMLGYTQGVGGFPKTNTEVMARSLGMYDLCTYELDSIEVINIPGSIGTTSIDLIKFVVPFNPEPPYASPTHLGMAYAALGTTDFDNDYNYLNQLEVNFLSEPFGDEGQRFVFMTDPDGVYLKLLELAGEPISGESESTELNINSMPYIGLNVSDIDAALDFYANLGYTEIDELPNNGSLEEAQAYGLANAFEIRGADVSLAGGDGNSLRLIQWLDPISDTPPYPAPISHIGIHRIALAVRDLDSAVDVLTARGVEFLSEIAPCCSGTGNDTQGIINAIDPDGIFVELVGAIRRKPLALESELCTEGDD
jgi:catechol 2,3-dioxygenase-like lactoylglutathione lyase family enzyme